ILGRKRPFATSEPRVHDMAPELGLRLDTEPGPVEQLEKSVGATHPRLDETHIGIEDRVLMLMVRDRIEAHRAVQARGMADAHADRCMWNHAHAVLRRETSDRDELREPRVRDLRLNDADAAAGEPRPPLINRAPPLHA